VLRDLQFFDPPGTDNALMQSGYDREAALAQIARRLPDFLPSLEEERIPDIDAFVERRQPVIELPTSEHGELHAVPSLPTGYQARAELLDEFRATLLGGESGAAGITTPSRVGLYGHGGVGKSVLACALARDEAVRLAFPDGIYWVGVGEDPKIPVLQERLANQLGVDITGARTNSERRRLLAEAVRRRRCLVIADDVWSGEGASSFNLSGPSARVLFTTRNEQILTRPDLRATRLMVSALTREEAVVFVEHQIGADVELPPVALEVIEQTGRVIFALGIAVAAFRNGLSWKQLHARFKAATRHYPDELEANFRAMRVALSTLSEREIDRYYDLVVFPTDESIPISTIDTLELE
jgi:hypothetical protein